jgi:hypothetical protein
MSPSPLSRFSSPLLARDDDGLALGPTAQIQACFVEVGLTEWKPCKTEDEKLTSSDMRESVMLLFKILTAEWISSGVSCPCAVLIVTCTTRS